MTSSVASAAEAASGLPANVEPWVPGENRAESFSPKAIMPPIGKPPATPLANVTISGVMPPDRSSRWNANHAPVRPMPVCTSSMISSASLASHMARTLAT